VGLLVQVWALLKIFTEEAKPLLLVKLHKA
jgi:hypothetical protein